MARRERPTREARLLEYRRDANTAWMDTYLDAMRWHRAHGYPERLVQAWARHYASAAHADVWRRAR